MSNLEINAIPTQSELGKKTVYDANYNPDKLFPIPRRINREKLGIIDQPPFFGIDIWNHYEVSWLNSKGKPVVGIAEIIYPSDSPNIIESKSMKLYFNSFNNTRIETIEKLNKTVKDDLEARIEKTVEVKIIPMMMTSDVNVIKGFDAICIDEIDVECDQYQLSPSYLNTEDKTVTESLYSDLLKSNCLVTNQPDWGSVLIKYTGNKINREGLLKYIVSFRDCNDFSEQCIEKIFLDIMHYCKPTSLTVYGRFTRRGGIDINPIRSTDAIDVNDLNSRFIRQ
jgi:7-cyano-7-deazaguanine reductase